MIEAYLLCHASPVMIESFGTMSPNHEFLLYVVSHMSCHINEKVANTEKYVWNLSIHARPGIGNCGESEAPSKWSPMWTDMGMGHETGKASHCPMGEQSLLLFSVWILIEWAENVQHSFVPQDVYSLKTASLQKLFLWRLAKSASLFSCM